MGKSVSKGSNGGKAPLEPSDFLSEIGFTPNPYANVSAKETLKQVPFDPKDYEYVNNPSSLDKGAAEDLQAARQPITDIIGRSLKQFGANLVGAIATSAVNTGDVGSTFDILSMKETDFNSEVFGVSTKDIMDWSNNVRNNNQIYEKNPGSFSPGSLSWWGNQAASTGTGIGMGIYALGETALVGAATEGLGAIPELFNNIKKFPQILKMVKGAKNLEEATRIVDIAGKLKRTATTYAIFNRLNESKMEAQQTYEEAYSQLLEEKNVDGTNKYTEEEARSAAAAGASRDFLWNMPLMALDILTYRTMVFNPFAGGGEGLIERGIGKIATKMATKGIAGKAVGWTLPHAIGAASEGLEEGLQFVGAEEGKHYAKVMAGQDDDSTFFSRLGKDVGSSEFWNNFAGGVIGSPVIGGVMKLFNKSVNGRSQKRLAEAHRDFVSNVGKMDDHISNTIREYEASGNLDTANVLRRNFGAMKALSSLYIDGLKGSDAAFDSYKNFLKQTLEEVNAGKFDSLQDLGFTNPTQEQVDQIKNNFQVYLQDADKMKRIFDQVSNQHERQFVPEISQQMFSLETRREKQAELQNEINILKNNVFGYTSLTNQGKELYDLNYEMLAIRNEISRLKKAKADTTNPTERNNYDTVINNNQQKLSALNERLKVINNDETYTTGQRDSDASIVNAPIKDNKYYQAIRDQIANSSQIDLESRNLALWNDKSYKDEQSIMGIINSRTKEQLDELERDLTERNKLSSNLKETIDNKRKKLAAAEAVQQQKGKEDDVKTPVVNNPAIENNQQAVISSEVTTQVQLQDTVQAAQTESTSIGSVIPQSNLQSASPTISVPLAENYNLFSEEMSTITTIANEQAGKGTNVETTDLLEEKLAKVSIPNLDDVISDGAGRLNIEWEGESMGFKVFDVQIHNKEASISKIVAKAKSRGEWRENIALSIIKLGEELQKKNISLKSGIKRGNTIYLAWDHVLTLGYAKEINDDSFSEGFIFVGKPSAAEDEFIGPVEISLSPVEISDSLTEEQKERLKGAVAKLLEGKDHPSFEDLVRAAIKQSNTDTADKTFNLLIKGWELNGYPVVDYRQTYAKIFQDPIDTLNSLLGELAAKNEPSIEQKVEVIQEATQEAIKDTINNQNKPNDFDNNGQPIYNYTGRITEEVQKKFAFLSVPYNLVTTLEDDGTITLKKETVGGEINPGDDVDSLKLLDPNKYIEGTEMQVMIPSNYMDIKVSVVNPDGTPGNTMPFSQYVAENNLSPNDQAYKDKVPMIIYDKGKTNERGLAFVHDVQWYNPVNFNQTKPGEMEEAIRVTREMRQAVLDSNKPVSITITNKRETTFEGLKLPQGTTISLKEANPEAILTVATNINQLTQDGKNIVFDGQLANVKPFSENMAYDVRQTGRKEGKAVYTAFPLTQPPLSDSSKSSIIMALKTFINAKNQNLLPGDKAIFDNIHTQILASSGIDIRSVVGIQQYLSQFMFVINLENANSVAEAEAQLKGKGKKEGYKYLTINSSGGITFGTLGKPMTPKNNGFFINPNPGKDPIKSFQYANGFLDNIIKTNFLSGYQQHLHFASLNKNKPVVQFNMKGEPTISPNYKEYLMNTLRTNIRSLNIGTASDPNYVTNVQPIITYELTSKLTENERSKTIEEIREEVIPNDIQGAGDNGTTEQSEQGISDDRERKEMLRRTQQELIKQAREELGLDFLTNIDDADLSPVELTEEQREAIQESTLTIAGLNPQQQYELIDFMYNQVVSQIDIDNKEGVSKEEVYKEVKKSFEAIIKPLRKSFVDKSKQIQDMIDLDPESPHIRDLKLALASYQNSIQRINDIQSSYKLMEAETELKISKYTNIHKSKLKENKETDDDSQSDSDVPFDEGDGSEERTKEFGTDSLSENPDNKLTYAMRRFLGQIRKVDKDGNPALGFLRLPVYVGSDTVASTVRDLLADVPSDFNVMMDKLERSVPAHPWLRELIDRLKGATREKQNQFVTVMSNHRLSMKFSMIAYDNKNKSWTSKVFNTFQSGLASQLALAWNVNFLDSPLVTMVNEVYTLNEAEAQKLVDEYDSWLGGNIPTINLDELKDILPSIATITTKKPTLLLNMDKFTIKSMESLKDGQKARFKYRNIDYQIIEERGFYYVSFLNKTSSVQATNVKSWLDRIGIKLSDAGFTELMTNGLYHNFEKIQGDALYTSPNGLFRILATALRTGIASPNKDLITGDGNPLTQSVVRSLANLESNFNTSVNSPNGRDNGKSIFGFTAPKFITDRTRDLKVKDGKVVQELSTISFSKKSLWLDLLVNSDKFRDQFEVSHIGLTAMKEMGKKVYKDNGITKLSDVDHELTKLIMFWDTKQGEVSYNNQLNTYGDSTIGMRMATMFVPTMSDKSNMMLLKTAVLNLEDKHFVLNEDGSPQLGTEGIKALYEQTVRPELLRMIKHAQLGGKTNISAYDKGAKMFMLIPELNYIKFNDDLLLIDAIAEGVEEFNLEFFESRPEYMNKILDILSSTINTLTKEKLNKWSEAGFLITAPNGEIAKMEFIDKRYSDKFTGTPQQKAYKAAIDFELNSMIATANNFMLYAGDPAMYFKSKSQDYIEMSKDSFVNVGKRLANQIAPGTTIANSENEKYIQLFIQDRVSRPETKFLKFATRVNDGTEITDKEIETLNSGTKESKDAIAARYPKSAGYFNIEGADAQEYTTWREHLSLLERLGKTSDSVFDVSPEEIQEARELFASYEAGKRGKLSAKQEKLIGKVLQPMKPVYTGQIYDPKQDAMRVVYIKSSSFPLIPQLTAGLEIDKLRQKMEDIESKEKMSVRASYQTANKVGSVTNAKSIWNQDGTANSEAINELGEASIILDRKNFRIQQDVPFKSGKRLEDKVTLGTQLMKILFGNGVIDADGFEMDGKTYNGKELHRIYNDSFDQLVKVKKQQLFDELGLNENGIPSNEETAIKKLQQILKDEAINRNYPIQDIEGLNLDSNGNFITPLWSSANSNRYEAMLNAIVSNRLIKIKFPGNSYVVGSEEGFKFQENLEGINQSKIIWTSRWNGQGLQGSFKKDGKIEKAQVLVASKFRNNKGELIDLFTKKDGEYTYVNQVDGKWMLKEDMIDPQLMSLTSFRIPTSGHVSAAQVEIVGILPAQNADLMIVPRNFTKQMGLDFDIDKQNTYQLWHYMNENGKFVELTEENKNSILNAIRGELKDGSAEGRLLAAIFGDELPNFTEEEIKSDSQLKAVNSKLQEKLLQNTIVKIHSAVLTNPSDTIQSKINGILSTDYAEEQADLIDKLTNKSEQVKVFTPLSSEYQKMKMGLGAAGKIGTGAYSLDVTFHSLVQQAKSLGNPLNITYPVFDEEGNMELMEKRFRFGTQVSDSFLGGEKTIDGDRSIAEVLAELQNVALDNEKLQVMGRVGLNDITIDVSKVFALLGFDKGTDEGKSSVQFTFLSQPIIRDFVTMIKNASSNMAEFSQDREQMVITQLINKYNPNSGGTWERLSTDQAYQETMSRRMSTTEMLAALETQSPDGALQEAILHRFLEMRTYGVKIRGVQTGINADAKGLGKSFFDVIARLEALNKIGKNNPFLQGTQGLIGQYTPVDGLSGNIPEGFINIGNYWVKPTTLTGSFNIHAVTTAYNLWSKHLPYDTPLMNMLYGEIMDVIGNSVADAGLIDNKAIILKQEIFKNLKKYLSTNPDNGIISNTDDINKERNKLYIDSDSNISLAKYVKSLKDTTGNRVIDNYIKTNKLISRFEFDIQKNGTPSLIKFNNAVGEEFDEQYLYNSLGYLLAANKPLPDYNGKSYTTTRLAQDLIAYTYLGNAIQEAIQFTKYIPVSYTNIVGYGDFMRKVATRLSNDPEVVGARLKGEDVRFDSDFTIQFLQHNPERVRFKIPASELASTIHNTNKDYSVADLNTLQQFSLVQEEGDNDPPNYISIYNKGMQKGEKKFQLYINQGNGVFKRVPVLGTFGMDEYNTTVTVNVSAVNGKSKAVVTPSSNTNVAVKKEARVDTFGINSGNSKVVLENIAKANIQGLSDLAKELSPYVSSLNIQYADIVSDGTANGENIQIRYNIEDKGKYHSALTILHEVVHGLTVRQIKPYVTEVNGTYQVVDKAPEYVTKLVQLYNVARSTIGEAAINTLRTKIAMQRKLNSELQSAATEEEKTAIRAKMSDVALTPEEKKVQYGAFNLNEFIAMSLTQPEFQREMSKHEFKNSGQSLLQRFKEVLNSILRAIGVDYSEKSVTVQAINSIFELIVDKNESLQTPNTTKFNDIAEEGFSDFEDLRDMEFKNFLFENRYDELTDPNTDTGPVETSLSPIDLPSVPNVNKNNCY